MTKLEQAARQALGALVRAEAMYGQPNADIQTALREALAEPELNLNCKSVQKRLATVWGYVKAEQAEQEPVAWLNESEGVDMYAFSWRKKDGFDTPLYTHPIHTKDLTDDEAQKLWNDTSSIVPMWAHHLHFARAVIQKFKEKNNANNNT